MQNSRNEAASRGLLLSRPRAVQTTNTGPSGLQVLDLGNRRDGLLYVPSSYDPGHPAPLALMLHGAGGSAHHGLDPWRPLAEEAGILVLAPDSRSSTWDMIEGGYGPDVAFIDEALSQVFARYSVDPNGLVIGGFSDGASYALSLGLTNGDLFGHIIAFSPGYAAPARQKGQPRIFLSHGTQDRILPIDRCSRRIVPMLRRAGYEIDYREFEGPHTVPTEIALEALRWFQASPSS